MEIRRRIILILLSLTGLSTYYVFDALTSIDFLVKQGLGLDASRFGLLYSFYSVGNVFFLSLFFSGILLDRQGYRKSGFLFVSLCLLGSYLTFYGSNMTGNSSSGGFFFPDWSRSLKVMLLGRMIFGMGSEALNIAIMKILATWFCRTRLAFAYAFAITVYRLGSFLALNFQIRIARVSDFRTAILFSVFIMAIGWVLFAAFLFLEKTHRPEVIASGEGNHSFHFRSIKKFPLSLWYLAIICLTFYGALQTFEIFDPDILKDRFSDSAVRSGWVSSVSLIGTLLFTPLIGYLVDRIGKRVTFLIFGSGIIFFSFIWLLLFRFPVLPIFLIGASYSLVAGSLWASVPLVVSAGYQGTDIGTVSYVQNMGLMLFPWVAGRLAQSEGKASLNYGPVLLLFLVLSLVSLFFSFILKLLDKKELKKNKRSLERV